MSPTGTIPTRRGLSALLTVLAFLATVALTSVGQLTTASPAAALNGPVTRDSVIARAQTWINSPRPYSQSAYSGGYRTDCSGYVSMAWDLSTPGLATNTLGTVSTQIPASNLQPGDILLKPKTTGLDDGHVALFVRWADAGKNNAVVYHQTPPRTEQTTWSVSQKQTSGYKPYRYNKITEAPSGNPFGVVESVSSIDGGVQVSGWALDPDTTASIPVHVYVNGVAAVAGVADRSRPDVHAVHNKGDKHGYVIDVRQVNGQPIQPGATLTVYALNVAGSGTNPVIGDVSAPSSHVPIGDLESVVSIPGGVRVKGWAFDFDTQSPINVHLYVNGVQAKEVRASLTRNDVEAVYPGAGTAHGFEVDLTQLNGQPIPAGAEIKVHALNYGPGAHPIIGTKPVPASAVPQGAVDSVTSIAGGVRVRGWVLDTDTTASTNAHIYINGVKVTEVTASLTRPDLAGFGVGDKHGFSVDLTQFNGQPIPLNAEIKVHALNHGAGAHPVVGTKTAPASAAPLGALDTVTSIAGGVRIEGWVLDPDTTASTNAHIYINGVKVTEVTASLPRPDLAGFGVGDKHGFKVDLTQFNGQPIPLNAEIKVYAFNHGAGAHPVVGTKTAPASAAPLGALDTVTSIAGGVRIEGWVLDPDTTASTYAHIFVNGVKVKEVVADLSRPDLLGFGVGDKHGFKTDLPGVPSGAEIKVYAFNHGAGAHPVVGTKTAP